MPNIQQKRETPPARTGGPACQMMIILVALISRAFYSSRSRSRSPKQSGLCVLLFRGARQWSDQCPIRKSVPKAEMPRTAALLQSRACPNQVAPGNETEPQNGDRVKQKAGLSKKTPYPVESDQSWKWYWKLSGGGSVQARPKLLAQCGPLRVSLPVGL